MKPNLSAAKLRPAANVEDLPTIYDGVLHLPVSQAKARKSSHKIFLAWMVSCCFVLISVVLILSLFNVTILPLTTRNEFEDPEAHMSMPEVVAYHGYPFEQYEVKSEDGFYTWIQRIPYGKYNKSRSNRKPVIIQHGLMGLSSVWVVNIPRMNLAYILAEQGYDVWLVNSRGNAFSLHHEKYKSTQSEFWFNDWHEMGYYDMPAFIDFILGKTGYSQVLYIGHSMGTTIGFSMLAARPEYNKKVKAAFMLAPVVTMNYATTAMRNFANYAKAIQLMELMGEYEMNETSPVLQWVLQKTCDLPVDLLCKLVLLVFVDSDALRLNITRAPVFTHLTPSSAPTQTVVHYGQIMESGKFQQFDYGLIRNLKHYNQSTPPDYNLTAISSAIYLYHGDADELASTQDVADLALKLTNLKKDYRVPDPLFNHMDFLWGLNVKNLLYNTMLKDMKAAWP